MSFKNSRLLSRSGRNQFGDPGDGFPPTYRPTPKRKSFDNKMFKEHKRLNDVFVATYGPSWLKLFSGLSKGDIWKKLCPFKKPSLSSFYAQSREFASMDEFLEFWLIRQKRTSLVTLGHSTDSIDKELAAFADCGRYGVRYGKKKRMIFTP